MDTLALWRQRYSLVLDPPRCNDDCDNCELYHSGGVGCLRQKRQEIGSIAYDKEQMCNPRSNVSSLFPSWLMKQNFDNDAVMVHRYEGTWRVVTGWDIARSEKVGADYLVGFTIAYDTRTKIRRILNITREKGVTFGNQIDMIAAHYQRYDDDYIIIEADMNQDLWVEQGKKKYPGLPVYSHYTRGAKKDLKNGVPSLLIPLENKLYRIPRGDLKSVQLTDIWMGEALSFGWENDKLEGVGEHDDTIIAWWKAEIGIKKITGGRITAGRMNMRGGVEF